MNPKKAERQKFYNRYLRDPEARKFYQSDRWRRLRRMKLMQDPFCETCRQVGKIERATMVHHSIPIRQSMADALLMSLLFSLCGQCHGQVEAEISKEIREDRGRGGSKL